MGRRRVFRSRRPDGRFVSTAGFAHNLLSHTEPRLAFDPGFTPRRFIAWQKQVRRKLRDLLRFPRVVDQPPPKRIWTRRRDRYALQRWELYPEPGCVVPVLVLVPDGVSRASRAPAALCFPGSSSSKELLAGEPEPDGKPCTNKFPIRNRMAQHYAKAGIVAIAVDNPTGGELADPICPNRETVSWHLVWAGRTYEGLSVFHKHQALQWVKTLGFVDRRRIATSGHSLGAKPALALGVLDPDVRAVVWNDFVSDWRQRYVVESLRHQPGWHVIPGFVQWFDYVDLLASLAPRPLLITEGGRTEDIRRIRRAYRLAGAPSNIKVVYYPKYATPAKRRYDRRKMPEGLSMDEYFRYANVDVSQHSFKRDVAVPWLARVLAPSSR